MIESIPENNTPTPQDVWAHELTFHSEGVMTVEKASGDYYLLTLPYKIEKFGWQTGEDYLMLEKLDDEPPYIRVEKASEEYDSHSRISSKKAIYKLVTRGSERPRIRIPKMWAEEFLSYGGDESLTVELNETEEEPHIRIYDGENVQERKLNLVRGGYSVKDGPSRAAAPLIPLVENSDEGYIDLSSETDLKSQKFKIVPFDGQSKAFLETAREQALEQFNARLNPENPDYESKKERVTNRIKESDSFQARESTFHKVKEEHGIPVTSVDELAISWYRECEKEKIDELVARGYLIPGKPTPNVEDQIIYREANTDCTKVTLPAKGSYFVVVEKDGETSRLPFFHREKNPLRNNSYASFDREYEKNWGILIKDHEEMPPTIYVPVGRDGNVSWTKYG